MGNSKRIGPPWYLEKGVPRGYGGWLDVGGGCCGIGGGCGTIDGSVRSRNA